MWKILQAVPRGIRNGLACYARRNPCLEEDQQRHQAAHDQQLPLVAQHRNYHHDSKQDQKFRVHDDCWSYMRKHSLLEALGWGAAFTAGIVASRPTLGQERKDESSLLLEYAAAMPVLPRSSVRDQNTAQRTKVNRSDSGFSESQSQLSLSPPDHSCLEPPEQSRFEPPTDLQKRLFESTSSSGSHYDTDFSWDSSSSSESYSHSNSSKLLESLNIFTINDVIDKQNDVTRQNDVKTSKNDVKTKNITLDTNAVKSRNPATENDVRSKNDVTPGTFADAVNGFEEACRGAWGRHCHQSAVKALKKDDDLKAAHHWLRASGAGYDKGQYNLGRCYEDGIGTYKDLEKAKYYYGLASAQGHVAATQRLERLVTTETASKIFRNWSSAQTAVRCRHQSSTVR